jgi:hypothetical protein
LKGKEEREEQKKDGWIQFNDMKTVGVYIGDIENREWRFRTRVLNPKELGERRKRKRRTKTTISIL